MNIYKIIRILSLLVIISNVLLAYAPLYMIFACLAVYGLAYFMDPKEMAIEEPDLFSKRDKLPREVRRILDKWDDVFVEYNHSLQARDLESFRKELEEVGYTFDYGLDLMPYNLRKRNHKKID